MQYLLFKQCMAPLRFLSASLSFPPSPSLSLSLPSHPLSPSLHPLSSPPLSLSSLSLPSLSPAPPLSLLSPPLSLSSLPLPSLSPLPPPPPLSPPLFPTPPLSSPLDSPLPPPPLHSPLSDVDPDDDNEQWFKAACYRCLIYMGDAGMPSVVFGPAVMSPSMGKKTTSTPPLPNYICIAPFLVHPQWYPQRSWVSLGRYEGMKSSCPHNTKWLPLGNRFQSRDGLDSPHVSPTQLKQSYIAVAL